MKKKFFSLPIAIIFVLIPLFSLFSQGDPLPSWNEGPAKQAIFEFVRKAKDISSPGYIAPANRIATFDQDGTLWVEQPLQPQQIFNSERIKALAPHHPEWINQEPFKAILADDTKAVAKLTNQETIQIVAQTYAGISTDAYEAEVKQWIATARNPRFGKLYTELVYQPMLEVLEYLRSNGFKTYIVTGLGQDFVRAYSQSVYGIPTEHVIGSSLVTKFEYKEGKPILVAQPKAFVVNNSEGKPAAINLFIGKHPAAAFGNSDGDRQMLEWTQGGGEGAKLMMLVFHDDPVREYAYGPADGLPTPDSGAFSESLMNEAKNKGWTVISMKKDWKRIFPFQRK